MAIVIIRPTKPITVNFRRHIPIEPPEDSAGGRGDHDPSEDADGREGAEEMELLRPENCFSKLAKPTGRMSYDPARRRTREKARISEATSGKIENTRIMTTAGRMKNWRDCRSNHSAILILTGNVRAEGGRGKKPRPCFLGLTGDSHQSPLDVSW
jgi:hypothetical protein